LSFRFLGIRYAHQPERFTYSTAYTGSGNSQSATSYGSECLQSGDVGSEDCLFLNIWTPYLPAQGGAPTQDLKPVMFWIHGGAFTSGTGNDPTFDGQNFASRGDVVLVTINYRLGSVGFLALNDGVTNGNYGFADQINALDWVLKNIQDFGGDPDHITVFGQSAGAGSVRGLLASPKAKGKFLGAIPQSNLGGGGYGTTYSQYLTIDEEMTLVGNAILADTNCSTASSRVDCLRAVPANTLANLEDVARYFVIDGTYLISDGLILNETDSLSNIHFLSGFMRDDGAAFISIIDTDNLTTSLTDDGFPSSLVESSGLFPLPSGPNATLDVFNVSARVATDTIFRCIDQATIYASLTSRTFAPNAYLYEFNRSYQTPSFNPNAPLCDAPITASYPYGDPNLEYFKCHSGDLYFVFGTILTMGYPLRDENDLPFSQFTLDSWSSFARAWNPNPDLGFLNARGYSNTSKEIAAAGQWLPVSEQKLMLRELEWPSAAIPFRDVEQCALLGWPLHYFV
jgi:carboxylesterase type B